MSLEKSIPGVNRGGYVDVVASDAVTLTGVADTEQDLVVIDNRKFRATAHVAEATAVISANASGASIQMLLYGGFDNTNWYLINVATGPAFSAGAGYIEITSSTTPATYRKVAASFGGALGFYCHVFPYVKWVVKEAAQDNAAGTVSAKVSGA